MGWNVGLNPMMMDSDSNGRPLNEKERLSCVSKRDVWLILDCGFSTLTSYFFLPGPVTLGVLLDTMTSFYHKKLTKCEKDVILQSGIFKYAFFSRISPSQYLRNATRASMRGDHVYLESFTVEHRLRHDEWTPHFGS